MGSEDESSSLSSLSDNPVHIIIIDAALLSAKHTHPRAGAGAERAGSEGGIGERGPRQRNGVEHHSDFVKAHPSQDDGDDGEAQTPFLPSLQPSESDDEGPGPCQDDLHVHSLRCLPNDNGEWPLSPASISEPDPLFASRAARETDCSGGKERG